LDLLQSAAVENIYPSNTNTNTNNNQLTKPPSSLNSNTISQDLANSIVNNQLVDNSELDVSSGRSDGKNVDDNTSSSELFRLKSPVTSSLKSPESSSGCVLRKRVNFNLKPKDLPTESPVFRKPLPQKSPTNLATIKKSRKRLRKTRSMGTGNDFHATYSNQMRRKYHNKMENRQKTEIRNVIFNGTFPIDMPLCSRFNRSAAAVSVTTTQQPPAASPSSSGSTSLESSDNDYYVKLKQKSVASDEALTFEELMENKRMSTNLCRLRKEFQESFLAFDRILSRKNTAMSGSVKTFDIDEPMFDNN
jgi:hypothetical protein